jgi:selenoprotein W-related protein
MGTKFIVVLSIFFMISTIGHSVNPSEDNTSSKHQVIVIEIHYCTPCCSPSEADSVVKELFEEFGVKAKLVRGKFGSFDVFINGELLFSKDEVGRFPISGELVKMINSYLKK